MILSKTKHRQFLCYKAANFFLILTFLCIPSSCLQLSCSTATPAITYTLDMPNPSSHYFHVTINVKGISQRNVEVAMPAFTPGFYCIQDFAANVKEFEVLDVDGNRIPWGKIDKQTWRIETQNQNIFEVKYLVYCNSVPNSDLNEILGTYQGPSVFMYLVGRQHLPVTLKINPPEGWEVLNSATEEIGQRIFHYDDYDIFVDDCTDIGNFIYRNFKIGDKEVRISFINYSGNDEEKINAYLAKVLKNDTITDKSKPPLDRYVELIKLTLGTLHKSFLPFDYPRYVFLLHFNAPVSWGLEHVNGSIIPFSSQGLMSTDMGLQTILHEYIHAWNIKRVRPTGFGPYDYSRESHTDLLWFVEGFAVYYSIIGLGRAGIYSHEQVLNFLADKISRVQRAMGRFERSLSQSSWDIWFHYRFGNMSNEYSSVGTMEDWRNVYVNYYFKGATLAMILDLEILKLTQNQKNLDDFMNLIYKRHYLDAPRGKYYLRGGKFTKKDFLICLNDLTGHDFTQLVNDYVDGTEDYDYNRYLDNAGLYLVETHESPTFGLQLANDSNWIRYIRKSGPAEKAELSIKDRVLSANDDLVKNNKDLQEVISSLKPDGILQLEIRRFGRTFQRTLKSDDFSTHFQIISTEKPTTKQLILRRRWLGQRIDL